MEAQLLTASLASLGCHDNQVAGAALALGLVYFGAATNRSVLCSVRIARYQLDARI